MQLKIKIKVMNKSDLEVIGSWPDVSNIDPLTINVVVVGVNASYGYTLVPIVGTCVFLGNVGVALVVLQAETGFVALGYLVASGINDIEVGEHLHAVIMAKEKQDRFCN